jgi:anti-anti-sigma factor
VPLYACERCGYTSAAFRPEAARLHRLEDPDCDGVMRIIFRSEERYRGELYIPPQASASSEGPATPQAPAPAGKPDRTLAIREAVDEDQALRLTLLGDLDLTAAETFSTHLAELKATGRACRLDLSRVTFIDSSGIQALLLALTDARWSGWRLEVARAVSPSVARAAQIVGIAEVLWPTEPGSSRTGQATTRPPSTA